MTLQIPSDNAPDKNDGAVSSADRKINISIVDSKGIIVGDNAQFTLIEPKNQTEQKSKFMSYSAKKFLALLVGISTIIASIAAVMVVPEFRLLVGLDDGIFSYQVCVQKEGTGEVIKDAKVIIEVSGTVPLTGYSDSNGYARIPIAALYQGKPGRLRVDAKGYKPYWKEIDVTKDLLPEIVFLVPLP